MNNTITDTLTTHIQNQLQQHHYTIEDLTGTVTLNGQHHSKIVAHKYQTINLKKHIQILIYPNDTQTDIHIKILTKHSRSKNNKSFGKRHLWEPPKLTLYTQAQNPNLLEQIEQQIK